jgi:uncharacterized protein YyaL (SSP411 family)
MNGRHDDSAAGERPAESPRHTNRLAGETSAYLRQHMHNPVDWHPWGAEALERARAEDKPLLVSIGYSACHWCHVMEHESFEDEATAALMNRLFVNVKVDREERPDVDQIYMDMVVRVNGHGGWPLTVFCAPDGRPFWGGTYFPPEPRHGMPSFREVLEAIAKAWREERSRVEESAGQILAALRARPKGVAQGVPGRAALAAAARRLLENVDREHGGFGGAPKFPTPAQLELLLAGLDEMPAMEAANPLSFLAFTCREMSRRGLYDQLAGGFHRYCVDDHWGIPHFEKMLYDQGQLLRFYVEVWRRAGGSDERGHPDLLWPVHETAAWLAREMRAPEGGFFASVDADSEGEEGRYYVWTPEQVAEVLGAERGAAFCDSYGVSPGGNFEHGTSVLWDLERAPREKWHAEREALLAARAKRVPPATDRKRVAAWNGLAVSGIAHAAGALGDAALLAEAQSACDFVLERMTAPDGRLHRVFAEGAPRIPAFLDDVASMLAATLDLFRAGGGERYLAAALGFAEQVVEHFYDEAEGDLFLTPADGERLAHRPRSDHDGATPHSPGLAVLGLVRAASLSGRADLRRVAERVVRGHAYLIERSALAYPTLLRAAAWLEREPALALVVGAPGAPDTEALARRARLVLAPEEAVVVLAPGAAPPPGLDPLWTKGRTPAGGRATVWLCRGTTCSLPVTDPAELAAVN